MKIVRYQIPGRISYGIIEGGLIRSIPDPFERDSARSLPFAPERSGASSVSVSNVRLLAPCVPRKIIGIGVNYAEHAKEMGRGAPPGEPMIFLKAPTSVIGPGDAILRPPDSARVDHEAELGVVIGRCCRHVREEDAASVIFGYTCVNDATARDLQARDVQFSRAKGFDTFCPLGPWIETELDPSDLLVEARVNGELRQSGRTSDMIHKTPRLIAHISRIMTLLPGDVIATGTPSGVGPLDAGDEVSVTVQGIGTLSNPVADEKIAE